MEKDSTHHYRAYEGLKATNNGNTSSLKTGSDSSKGHQSQVRCLCFGGVPDKASHHSFLKGFIINLGICALLVAYTLLGSFIFLAVEGGVDSIHQRTLATTIASGNQYGKRNNTARLQQINSEARERTVENIWEITVNLNILYRENWTRLAAQEIARFQDQLVKRITEEMIASQSSGTLTKTSNNDGVTERRVPEYEWNFAKAFLYSLTVLTTIETNTTQLIQLIGKMNGNSEIRGQEILFQEIADIHYSEEYFSSVIFFMWGKKYLCSGAIVGILYAITVDDCADKIVLRPHVFAYSFYKTEAVNEFGHIEYSTGDLAFVEGIGKLQLVMLNKMPEQTCELTPIPVMNLNETPEKTSVNGILQHYGVRVIRKNIKPNINVPVFELLEGIELANDFIYEAIDCEVEKIEETSISGAVLFINKKLAGLGLDLIKNIQLPNTNYRKDYIRYVRISQHEERIREAESKLHQSF